MDVKGGGGGGIYHQAKQYSDCLSLAPRVARGPLLPTNILPPLIDLSLILDIGPRFHPFFLKKKCLALIMEEEEEAQALHTRLSKSQTSLSQAEPNNLSRLLTTLSIPLLPKELF